MISYCLENRKSLTAHTYFSKSNKNNNITDLLNIEEIASLIVDPTILKAAENHLGCIPKLQNVELSPPFFCFSREAWNIFLAQ